ncbi:isoprenylcysteine carboxylmethyltransferase family protein [Hydrogenophaga sp. PAMC20947]|uniref:methyltransferase family protein n=1 Tax=Hydrogenophaga sp. PAMC20947 TaxID=2565558 RepID=UPI001FF7346C|nr:isoprenylcysteine carboxylmethyltransferase family protein [Hydrogenophaga sp. PAMC20947]
MQGLNALETRIPPPVVALVLAFLMWNGSVWLGAVSPPAWRLALVAALVALGAVCDLSGVWAFHRARTTVNPMKPGSATSLVTAGIYRWTRNPMYVGMVLFLTAGAVYLWSIWALPGPLAFVVYINRFQIGPEERVMRARFGEAYEAYCRRVRRWM